MRRLLICVFCIYSLVSFAVVLPTNLPPKPVNLNLKDVPVRDVLQILSELNHRDSIISDTVKGNISIHIENMPWQQAMNVILQARGLGEQHIDNVVMIAPASELIQRQAEQLQMAQALQNIVALQSVFILVHNGKAEEIAAQLKNQATSLLSSRGSVTVDARTNALWIQDVPERIAQIQQFIRYIDVPAKQVLIEARIVNIDEKCEQELGLRFGVTRPGNNLSGTLNGANSLASSNGAATINPLDRLNIDLPSVNPQSASIGLALATLGGGTLLDLELSALESEGKGEIISSPRLITANQQAATILSGQEIPYQEATASGATNISFQKAVLSLTVTPQITSADKLILNLHMSQDRPSGSLIQGVPSIDTRQIQTQITVNNGQTIVLGGIYESSKENQVQRVPFFGNLPIIGNLFRHSFIKNDRRELLIFVTPTIVA
jgi:type IV pilus assembly protein PilQ